MEKKESKSIIVIMILLILMVLGLGGYIAYGKVFSKDKEVNEPNEKSVRKLDVNSSSVKDLLDMINFDSGDIRKEDIFYSKKKVMTSDLDDKTKVELAYCNLSNYGVGTPVTEDIIKKEAKFTNKSYDEVKKTYDVVKEFSNPVIIKTIEETDLISSYEKVFGEKETYKPSTISCPFYYYDSETKRYNGLINDGCGDAVSYQLFEKTIDAEKYDDRVEITVAVAIKDLDKKWRSFFDKTVIYNDISSDLDDISAYTDKIDHFKYTFKSKDLGYYFYSVEKVK